MKLKLFVALTLASGLLAGSARAAEAPKPPATASHVTVKDQELQALLLEKGGEAARGIRVTIDGKTAILTGDVPTRAAQEIAEEVALSVDGIKSVDNRLKIVGEKDPRDKLTREAADARLESTVKRRLRAEIGKRAGQIEVEAVDDIISLRGTVPDANRKQLALDTARKTKGVREVIDLIKVAQ